MGIEDRGLRDELEGEPKEEHRSGVARAPERDHPRHFALRVAGREARGGHGLDHEPPGTVGAELVQALDLGRPPGAVGSRRPRRAREERGERGQTGESACRSEGLSGGARRATVL